MNGKVKAIIAAFVVAILFTAIACTASVQTLNSAEDLKAYLDKQPANTPDKPIKVSIGANELMLPKIVAVLRDAGKYVNLNLTGSALTYIPKYTFSDESTYKGCVTLVAITLPNSVIGIGQGAFEGCTNLASVTIPDSVKSIGQLAFQDCASLTSVTIGTGVTSIERPFTNSESLTAINVAAGNSSYSSENGVLYNKNKTVLHSYPKGKTDNSFVIPNGVTSIDAQAFAGCSSLTSVTIPNSVTSIGNSSFSGCSGLTSVTIPNSVTSIGYSSFSGCSGLTSVTIPDSVTNIESMAFLSCRSLTSVTFQGNIPSDKFGDSWPFLGDLRAKYRAGGIGTYTTTAPVDYFSKWTKQ